MSEQILMVQERERQRIAKDLHDGLGQTLTLIRLGLEDLKQLPVEIHKVNSVYISGLMGGLENAPLTPTWRKVARMVYPLETPELRKARMNFPLGWLKIRNIPVVDELSQANTYLACGILAETITDMQVYTGVSSRQ